MKFQPDRFLNVRFLYAVLPYQIVHTYMLTLFYLYTVESSVNHCLTRKKTCPEKAKSHKALHPYFILRNKYMTYILFYSQIPWMPTERTPQTTSSPSFAQSLVCDAQENHEKKMPRESRPEDLTQPFFLVVYLYLARLKRRRDYVLIVYVKFRLPSSKMFHRYLLCRLFQFFQWHVSLVLKPGQINIVFHKILKINLGPIRTSGQNRSCPWQNPRTNFVLTVFVSSVASALAWLKSSNCVVEWQLACLKNCSSQSVSLQHAYVNGKTGHREGDITAAHGIRLFI